MYKLNFCAGPAKLPTHIYSTLSQMILNYKGTGLSLLSLSHRDLLFTQVNNNIKKHLKTLLKLPKNYEILLMPAGASGQFAAIPMNLKQSGKALYLNSGYWANVAINEAKKFVDVDVREGIDLNLNKLDAEYDYVHYTDNETVDGMQWSCIPLTNMALVCDMSSSFLSKPINITKYDLIYAGAQKNIGLPGVTVVVIKKKLIENVADNQIPAVLNYKEMYQADSLYNTPDVIAWTAMELVLDDLINLGGLDIMKHKNAQKAELLYKEIDKSKIFNNKIVIKNRSKMNVVFQLPTKNITSKFLEFTDQHGIYGIAGHRSVGGMRVSLYNAIDLVDVEKLISVMHKFEKNII